MQLGLYNQRQSILSFEAIWDKLDLSLASVFKNPSAQHVVGDDFNRVWAWTRMLAEQVDQQTEKDVRLHRIISFNVQVSLRPEGDVII